MPTLTDAAMTSFALPPAAARAVLELRALVEGKGLAFTPPSVGRRWQQGRKLAVFGHFETAGLFLYGDLRAER
jgi:hypothetical protein